MKARITFLSLLFIASGLMFTSCNDDDDDEDDAPPPTTNTEEPSEVPDLPMADAVLVAVQSKSTQDTPIGPIAVEIGTGVGVFYESGSDNLVAVGAVSLNGNQLTQNNNNSYTYIPSLSQPTGIDNLDSETTWEVEGGNGFPMIMESPGFTFPNVGDISGDDTVDRSQDYTITISSVSSADSIIYSVSGVTKTLAGNVTSCTFSSDELSAAPAGVGIIQAAPYAYESVDLSGKSVYFLKEIVVSKSVTIE